MVRNKTPCPAILCQHVPKRSIREKIPRHHYHPHRQQLRTISAECMKKTSFTKKTDNTLPIRRFAAIISNLSGC